jgi:choline dehydrogenase
VDNVRPVMPLAARIIDAAVQVGLPLLGDYNADPAPFGVAHTLFNMTNGRRASALAAYLKPATHRSNLHILTNTYCAAIVFEGNRAVGTRLIIDGTELLVRARGEVILSAGAISSPKILELSGVGEAGRLRALGIGVVADRPSVGENLQDHLAIGTQRQLRGIGSLNQELRGYRLVINSLRYGLTRRGILASTHGPVTGFARVQRDALTPDVQFFGSPLSMGPTKDGRGMEFERRPGVTVTFYQLRPASRGSCHISTSDSFAAPVLKCNYLSFERDRDVAVKELRLANHILDQPALSALTVAASRHEMSDADLLEYARATAGSAYHLCGTCRMGADAASVVDSELRVRGTRRLRVIDASIFPNIVSANTVAATLLVAEKGAELLLAAPELSAGSAA